MSYHAIEPQRCFATNDGDTSHTRADSISLSSAILSLGRAIGLMLIAVAATSVAPRDCLAFDVNWQQPAFGQYRTPESWAPSIVPDQFTDVYFGRTIGTTVANETVLFITGEEAAQHAYVVSGNYTFQFANTEVFGDDGPPYLTYRTSSLTVGSAIREVTLSDTATLTVNIDPFGHPGKIESKDINIGPPIGADETARPGTLILDGEGVTLEVTPAAISDVGDKWRTTIIGGGGNSGRLEVRNGAQFITPPELGVYDDDGTYGTYPSYLGLGGQSSFGFEGGPKSGHGEMLVTGVGSLVDAKGSLWIANNGTANVEVRDGGLIKTPFIGFGSVYWDGRGGIGPIEGIGRLIVSGAGMDDFQQPIRSYVRTPRISFYDPHSAIEVYGEAGVLIAADNAVNIFHPNGSVYLHKTGSFTGTGTIKGNFIIGKDAVYSPGSSPGTLTVEGDFEMEEGAHLTLEIGGATPQVGYDQILVDGDVTLRGIVDLKFINNFQPHVGDVFNLLSASGAFSHNLATIRVTNAPSGFTFATLTTPQGIGLGVVPEPSTLPLAAVSLGCACFIVRRRHSCIASATAATEVPERRSRSRRHSVFDVRNRPNGRPNTPTADFNVLSCLRKTLTQRAGRVLVSVFIVVLGDSISNGQVINLEDDPLFEAKTLALEFSGELRPPISLVTQFDHDLNLIRQVFPQVADIYALPNIVPGEIFVGFTAAGDQAFQNGTFSGFDSLFTELGTPTVRHDPTLPSIFMSFGAFYHSVRLAEMFAPIEGVRYSEPNIYGYCCGELVDIVARDGRSYLFSRGPAEYEFSVTERTITLWRQPGSSEPVVVDLVPEPSTLLLAAMSLGFTCYVVRGHRRE